MRAFEIQSRSPFSVQHFSSSKSKVFVDHERQCCRHHCVWDGLSDFCQFPSRRPQRIPVQSSQKWTGYTHCPRGWWKCSQLLFFNSANWSPMSSFSPLSPCNRGHLCWTPERTLESGSEREREREWQNGAWKKSLIENRFLFANIITNGYPLTCLPVFEFHFTATSCSVGKGGGFGKKA